jgi:thioredoxin 1
MNNEYPTTEPTRAQVDAIAEPLVLEFGAPWCGICAAAQPAIAGALMPRPLLKHLKVSDGPGLPLGRSFGIKLWPTLVLLQHGAEIGRLVRPTTQAEISTALDALLRSTSGAA